MTRIMTKRKPADPNAARKEYIKMYRKIRREVRVLNEVFKACEGLSIDQTHRVLRAVLEMIK